MRVTLEEDRLRQKVFAEPASTSSNNLNAGDRSITGFFNGDRLVAHCLRLDTQLMYLVVQIDAVLFEKSEVRMEWREPPIPSDTRSGAEAHEDVSNDGAHCHLVPVGTDVPYPTSLRFGVPGRRTQNG